MTVTIDEVRERCTEGRYFVYGSLQDRLFAPVALYLVWFFVRLGVSGNAVSWLSAVVAILGAVLLTSSDSLLVLIGSFGYILWYLLDYVDGAVARFNGKASVAGQYIDWVMHVISHLAIITGIAIGAMSSSGAWIHPFMILGIVASGLAYAKFSMAWFAICMEQQQRRVCGRSIHDEVERETISSSGSFFSSLAYIRNLSVLIFHENWLIFTLPLFAAMQYWQLFGAIDFRVVFTIIAGSLYFTVQVLEIHRLVITKRVQKGYSELFSFDHRPILPNDHFFK